MNFAIYIATYFDRVMWVDMTLRIIAENEQQVREIVDKMCKERFRGRGIHGNNIDDLKISKDRDIPFPYILSVSGE